MPAGRLVVAVVCLSLIGHAPLRGTQAAGTGQAPFTLTPLLDHDHVVALFDLYERKQYEELDRRLAALSRIGPNWVTFEAAAEGWVASSTQPERHRLVAAAVALEVASIQAGSWEISRLAIELGCRLLLNQPPIEAERGWHRAVVALARLHRDNGVLSPNPFVRPPVAARANATPSTTSASEGSATASGGAPAVPRPSLVEVGTWLDHSRHIAMRFPDEPLPAFQNALALESRVEGNETLFVARDSPVWMDAATVDSVAAEGRQKILAIPPNRRMDRQSAEKLMRLVPELAAGTAVPGAVASAALTSRSLWLAVDAYQPLVDRKTVASEAYFHLGQTYIRLAQPREALIAFRRADETAATPYEAYLARTLAGAALERVGRHDDAMLAFLGALEAFPRAQSATLAVAPILFQSGRREQAADLLEAAVKLPVTIDPLQYYWVGDPEAPWRALQQVRQALK